MKKIICIVQLLVLLILATPVLAQLVEGMQIEQGPIHITSQRLEAKHKEQQITFVGDVVATQEGFVLYSDRLHLFLQKGGKEIDRIVAQGNVRIVQGNRKATCEEATYYHQERKLILLGDPAVREGDNWVRGWRIIYYVDGQKSVVEGKENKRVTVTIVPGEEIGTK